MKPSPIFPRKSRIPLVSWAFYDFANTIFSAIVLTAYFPLYLTELAGANWYLGAASSASMVLAGAVVPFLGALSDKTGRTKKYLMLATLACIFFLFFLSVFTSPLPLAGAFLISCFFYHAALVFYNSLLPVVADESNQGFASGLGTGLGYLGVVCALPVAHWVDTHFGRRPVFSAAAVLFLLFSLPVFFFVPERETGKQEKFRWGLWFEEWRKVLETVRGLGQKPALLLFLGGNFFVVDALNSTIFWFLVYAREVFHPGQKALILLLAALNAAAFAAGILAGILTDRIGAMKTLLISSLMLAATLAALAVLPDFRSFVAVSLLGGSFAIAGVWTAGRKALIEMVEAERVGEYFGLYGLVTKISVIGSFVFSLAADYAGFRPALAVLIFPAAAGCFFLFWSGKTKDSV